MAVVIDGTNGISSPDYEVDGVTGQVYPVVSGTAVSASAAAYKAAAASTSATAVNAANTIALGENSLVDADKDGLPVSVTMGGAAGTGTIQLTMMYVID